MIQGIGVVADHPQHVPAGLADQFLAGKGAGQEFHGTAHVGQLFSLFPQALFVDRVPFDDMLFQDPRGPLAEAGFILDLTR